TVVSVGAAWTLLVPRDQVLVLVAVLVREVHHAQGAGTLVVAGIDPAVGVRDRGGGRRDVADERPAGEDGARDRHRCRAIRSTRSAMCAHRAAPVPSPRGPPRATVSLEISAARRLPPAGSGAPSAGRRAGVRRACARPPSPGSAPGRSGRPPRGPPAGGRRSAPSGAT